jgi:hypothetical protein
VYAQWRGNVVDIGFLGRGGRVSTVPSGSRKFDARG